MSLHSRTGLAPTTSDRNTDSLSYIVGCKICYNEYGEESPEGVNEAPLRLPRCKHVFGDHCLKRWLAESNHCPYCRDKLPAASARCGGARDAQEEYLRARALMFSSEYVVLTVYFLRRWAQDILTHSFAGKSIDATRRPLTWPFRQPTLMVNMGPMRTTLAGPTLTRRGDQSRSHGAKGAPPPSIPKRTSAATERDRVNPYRLRMCSYRQARLPTRFLLPQLPLRIPIGYWTGWMPCLGRMKTSRCPT